MAKHSRNKKVLEARERRLRALTDGNGMIVVKGRTLQPGTAEYQRALGDLAELAVGRRGLRIDTEIAPFLRLDPLAVLA